MSDYDDPRALMAASPLFPPVLKPKPLFSVTVTFDTFDVDPEVLDLIMYGESPGPHITLGEQ
jgi:hypothetical protein